MFNPDREHNEVYRETRLLGDFAATVSAAELNEWSDFLFTRGEYDNYIDADRRVLVAGLMLSSGAETSSHELVAAIKDRREALRSCYDVGKKWFGQVVARRKDKTPKPPPSPGE